MRQLAVHRLGDHAALDANQNLARGVVHGQHPDIDSVGADPGPGQFNPMVGTAGVLGSNLSHQRDQRAVLGHQLGKRPGAQGCRPDAKKTFGRQVHPRNLVVFAKNKDGIRQGR